MSELLRRCLELFSEGLNPAPNAPAMNPLMRITAAEMLLGILREENELSVTQLRETARALGWSRENIDVITNIGQSVHSLDFRGVEYKLTNGYRIVHICKLAMLAQALKESHEQVLHAQDEGLKALERLERSQSPIAHGKLDSEEVPPLMKRVLIAAIVVLAILVLIKVVYPDFMAAPHGISAGAD